MTNEALGKDTLYRDPTPLGDTKNIETLIDGIRHKTMGADVREAIATALEVTYETAASEGNANMEVAKARGTEATLGDRLQSMDGKIGQTTTDITRTEARIDDLIANAGNGTVPSELTDMRVVSDGTTYPTAGTAVRKIDDKIMASLEKNSIQLPQFNDGTFLQYSDGRVGALGDSQIATTTAEFIDVGKFNNIMVSNFVFLKDNNAGLAFYDANKSFIKGLKYSDFKDKSLTVPTNAKYIKFSVPTVSKTSVKVFGFLDEAALFELTNLGILNTKDSVSEYNASFIEKSKNIFDASTITRGVYVRNADGSTASNSSFSASDYIAIEPGQAYTKNFVNQGAFYDANKQYIVGFDGFSVNVAQVKQTINAPHNARFVRISLANTQVSLTQLEEGSEMTAFEPFGYSIKPELIEKHIVSSGRGQSKNIADLLVSSNKTIKIKLIGDSITHGYGGTGYAQDGEQIITNGRWNVNTKGYCWANLLKKDLESRFNCTVTNFGCSGVASPDLVSGITDLIKDDDDVVICQIGTNNRGDGDIQRFEYLAGDLEFIYQYCQSRNIKFIPMIAPPASQKNESAKSQHMEDVAHVISAFAQKHNLDYINNFRNLSEYCELKDIAIDTLLMDGLHPSDRGYELMYRHITRELGLDPKIKQATW